ncbi:MAG: RlmE family RNA methyltransferase [Spirochaetia bacterium]|jgi:23S rRNA (uridine2552-2'-O)-methyltransferase|nr:RlmE family RNA methyltransferase [Spirochaetia bacterium]
MSKKNNPRADDHYTMKAKKEGYPARSVYKLMEIQKKFSIINRSSAVLDIGAAPGSWSLYLIRELGSKGVITAVDLLPLDAVCKGDNFFFIQGDAFSQSSIASILEKGPYNTVLSDAAPSTTGNKTVDTERSFQLVSSVLDLAEKVLLPGGNIAVKIFQGGDEKKLMERLKKMFAAVKAFKPEAVRKISFETYLVGTGFNPAGKKEEEGK